MQAVHFQTLSRSVQERFVEAIDGRSPPAPIAQDRVRSFAVEAWLATIVLATVVLGAFAMRGFGAIDSPAALHGPGSVVVYVALVALIALGLVRVGVLRAEARSLPYPRGVYVFPTSVVDAREEELRVYPLAEVTGIEALSGAAAGASPSVRIALHGGETFSFRGLDPAEAQLVAAAITRARSDAETLLNDPDPRTSLTFTVDPLQRPRVSAPLGPRGSLAQNVPLWLRNAWVVVPVVAILGGPALRVLRNVASDARLFARTNEIGDARAYRAYLAVAGASDPGHHRDVVERVSLPRAELRAAAREGTVEAIDRFVADHPVAAAPPGSPIAADIAAARRHALLDALEVAKRPRTLRAIQDFARRYPDHRLEPEIAAAVHALFVPALERFRKNPPDDPKARAFVERLFAYCEAKAQAGIPDTTVHIRFRHRRSRAPSTISKADKMVTEHPWFVGEASYPSRYFDDAHWKPREAALAKSLAERLSRAFGGDVLTFEEGPRFAPSDAPPWAPDTPPAVASPTLVITHGEEWPGTFDGSVTKPRGIWIGVHFDFDAAFVIPRDAGLPYKLEVAEKPAMDVARQHPEGGTPNAPLEEKIYGAMAERAVTEFEGKYPGMFLAGAGRGGM